VFLREEKGSQFNQRSELTELRWNGSIELCVGVNDSVQECFYSYCPV